MLLLPKSIVSVINLKAAKQIGLTIPPNVIVVTGVGDLCSAKEATATIPIVMDSDPVGSGFVASLAEDPQMLAGCQMFQGRHEQQQQADNLHRTPSIACVTRCRVCASLG